LLILNQEASGADMTVQEIPEVPPMSLQAVCAPLKLNDWLVARIIAHARPAGAPKPKKDVCGHRLRWCA